MECAIQPTKSQKELLETYKKTMHMIQNVKGQFDFPDLEAERKSMYTDGLNDPNYELKIKQLLTLQFYSLCCTK